MGVNFSLIAPEMPINIDNKRNKEYKDNGFICDF